MNKDRLENYPKAIIFDLDGTLIDSIPAHLYAYQELAMSEFGIQLNEEKILEHFGKTTRDILTALFPHSGKNIDILVEKKQRLYRQSFNRVKLLPGTKKVLRTAKERSIKCALGTSSSRENVEIVIKEFGLEFDVVITGEDIEFGKPNPETFLTIAQRLDLSPDDCFVIGDAIYDMMAAKKAGMLAIGVLTGNTTRRQMKMANADVIVENLLEFMQWARLT
ncbi:MAG: HAD family hydrolase [Promethearchaeota archaeon]